MAGTSDLPRPIAQFSARWRFTLLVPLRYNADDSFAPGERIEAARFAELESRLLGRFGGYSRRAQSPSIVEGQWHDPATGHLYTDRGRLYEVVTERRHTHEEFFLRLHAWAAGEFRQVEILLVQEAVRLATPLAAAQPASGSRTT